MSTRTWHEVEYASYEADLPLWRELAAAADGPVLDLGAGTGRVAIDLAGRGHDVTALDTDADMLAALAEHAAGVTTVTGDARDFDLPAWFALILAPMQLLQIVGGPEGRARLLRRARDHLKAGGTFAAAVADAREALPGKAAAPPLPDMLERDGWLFSSQPVAVEERDRRVIVTRRREAVSPAGDREEETVEIALDVVSAGELEDEARGAGLTPRGWRAVTETPDHIGGRVIVCGR